MSTKHTFLKGVCFHDWAAPDFVCDVASGFGKLSLAALDPCTSSLPRRTSSGWKQTRRCWLLSFFCR